MNFSKVKREDKLVAAEDISDSKMKMLLLKLLQTLKRDK